MNTVGCEVTNKKYVRDKHSDGQAYYHSDSWSEWNRDLLLMAAMAVNLCSESNDAKQITYIVHFGKSLCLVQMCETIYKLPA
jgi:hypothetical protein